MQHCQPKTYLAFDCREQSSTTIASTVCTVTVDACSVFLTASTHSSIVLSHMFASANCDASLAQPEMWSWKLHIKTSVFKLLTLYNQLKDFSNCYILFTGDASWA